MNRILQKVTVVVGILMLRTALVMRAKLGIVSLFWLYTHRIKGRRTGQSSGLRILVLAHHEFRGEPEALALGGAQVFYINPSIQNAYTDYYVKNIKHNIDYYGVKPHSHTYQCRQRLIQVLNQILPIYYKWLRIDCVLSHDLRAWRNADWGSISDKLGVAYIILYRETFLIDKKTYDISLTRHKKLKQYLGFDGRAFLVSNSETKRMLVESQITNPEKIYVTGNSRMDQFVVETQDTNYKARYDTSAGPVVLFSTVYRNWISGDSYEYTDRLHITFAEIAKNNSFNQFIIKFKPAHQTSAYWLHLKDKLTQLDLIDLSNMTIDFSTDAHELIHIAKGVVGVISTSTLEAALAGKWVILPAYKDLQCSPDWVNFGLKNHLHLFNTVIDDNEYRTTLEHLLQSPIIHSEEVMHERKVLFERWVSTLDGQATKRTLDILQTLCSQSPY
ncbi:MAG: hypothetical protein CL398_01920 [Acidiferrobacteraceae bacterium]|nr:hypothetical protein [Acidiferrobacteraceae bacterium]